MTDDAHPGQRSPDYPSIGSLGVVGDGHSLALIGPDGNIEWFCPVRFDAPPLVWPLLDRRRGGCLRVGPAEGVVSAMRYLDETAVIECDWQTGEGHARATFCMEWPRKDQHQRLLWMVRGLSGTTNIDVEFMAKFDFGRTPGRVLPSDCGATLETGQIRLCFQAPCSLRLTAAGMQGRMRVEAGEVACFCLSASSLADNADQSVPLSSVGQRIDATLAAWRDWSAGVNWAGRHRDSIVRSAITLKLLIYEPTGAAVAAGTTSLPEEIGGVRNWDYRYTWFRDAGLTLSALFSLGCRHEAHRWAEWMHDTFTHHGTPLRVLYSVDGKHPPAEYEIAGIEGYRGSSPVRVGNAAEMQFQLDVYGEFIQCVFICDTMHDDAMRAHWSHMRMAADFIAAHWRDVGSGIWEVRGAPRHFVHSKVTAWAGLQAALWLQRRHGLGGDRQCWIREADALREDVLRQGLSRDGKRFVRSYGEDAVDASLLVVTRGGFIDGASDLFRNTVDAVRTQLGAGGQIEGLLRRYNTDGHDGVPGGEGAFAICSFWLVEALAMSGRRGEAEDLFERLLTLQGDLGLYAEQVDPSNGEQLGNFPQAFTHLGLINAALRLRRRPGVGSSFYPFP